VHMGRLAREALDGTAKLCHRIAIGHDRRSEVQAGASGMRNAIR
jgi:hypothetical protein